MVDILTEEEFKDLGLQLAGFGDHRNRARDEDRFKQNYIKIALQRNGREVHAYYSHEFLERVQRSRQ